MAAVTGATAAAATAHDSSDVLLRLRGVSHRYLGTVPALDGVDLEVRAGESVALLGANGCGKSTLLRVMDGLLFPCAGSYTAFGQAITEDSLEDAATNAAFRSRIGIVLQSSDVQLFSTTVREELAFGCRQIGLDEPTTTGRVAQALALLELEDLADRPPFQLSGGQKKRVALGSVLVMNPQVVLMDEPTAALDPRSQEWLTSLVVALHRAGTTIVLASHDLAAVATMTTRAVVLGENHRVVADAPTAQVLERRELLVQVNLVGRGWAGPVTPPGPHTCPGPPAHPGAPRPDLPPCGERHPDET